MQFTETKLKGAYIIELEPHSDERGFFARSFCKKEFEKLGLNPEIVQCNVSYNKKVGTLRGMHFQKPPFEETKIVSVTKGAIYDVIIDLKTESDTYCQWFAVELTEGNNKMLYIPEGFAHGFQTLSDDTIVYYQMGNYYNPEYADGIRWDDLAFNIKWPECENRVISEKDLDYSYYKD
ncbi:MAG: dTDP-4-dehydrorhamnose 3,5-epimerase [Candidatus Melainabacteria bacterium GWF2_37_15]|nr:MAG: dTDP-4-dehydrorhamnose 3,5-epimerase [Candidatus Melainabacteria bacterium GWF2_37_15]